MKHCAMMPEKGQMGHMHTGMNPNPGHVMHHLAMEHAQHGMRMHHEAEMHHMAHERSMGEHQGHMMYRNEVEKPRQNPQGHLENSMGASDFKGQAMDIAYGQAGMRGCESDGSKIVSQFKDYHWSGASGDASGY